MSGAARPAATPAPPYYAVIFTTLRREGDDGYAAMAELMQRLAEAQPGYLGIEAARETLGVTVSYWRDLAAIAGWRDHVDHAAAPRLGRQRWYTAYQIRIARVERAYDWRLDEA